MYYIPVIIQKNCAHHRKRGTSGTFAIILEKQLTLYDVTLPTSDHMIPKYCTMYKISFIVV